MASWKEGDISRASKKAKRRYFLYKAAIKEYKEYKDAIDHVLTGDVVDTIARRYDLSVELIERLAKRCAMLHEDGAAWGFRALVPGALWSPAQGDGLGRARGEREAQAAGDPTGPPR